MRISESFYLFVRQSPAGYGNFGRNFSAAVKLNLSAAVCFFLVELKIRQIERQNAVILALTVYGLADCINAVLKRIRFLQSAPLCHRQTGCEIWELWYFMQVFR